MTTDTENMLATVKSGDIMAWSDEKRQDFITLYRQRAEAHSYILRVTAEFLLNRAYEAKVVGYRMYSELRKVEGYNSNLEALTGRTRDDLNGVAQEAAKSLFAELPGVKAALKILNPGVLDDMETLEKLRATAQELTDQINELTQPIKMSAVDQDMTVGEFRAYVKSVDKKRRDLQDKLEEVSTEGSTLQAKIDKALYKGIPGLSDEVVDAVKRLYEMSEAARVTMRRVEEQVLYGDSKTAMTLLNTFNQDEKTTHQDIAARLREGLARLGADKKTVRKLKKSGK